MKTNFAFLKEDELTEEYFTTAMQAEISYATGVYSSVLTLVRNVAENLARDIADQQFIHLNERDTFNDTLRMLKEHGQTDNYAIDLFYKIKAPGNKAAHQLATATLISQKEALDDLKSLYTLMVWFVNTYYDENVDMTNFSEPTTADFLYTTTVTPPQSERNIIYIESADTSDGHFKDYVGNQKIGKATAGDLAEDNTDNSSYLREIAKKRISQYMTTAGVPMKLNWVELAYRKSDGYWFTDNDVHDVLDRSGVAHSKNLAGREWYQTDLETAKRAIKAVKAGQSSIDLVHPDEKQVPKIILRPEQQTAVDKTEKAFKNHDKMLWNAKMRFGKTLSALQLVKDEKYQHVLIMTHRPVVDEGWFEDFNKIQMPEAGYEYGSKTVGHDFDDLKNSDKPFVYFASLQDLRGSEMVGGKAGNKNVDLFNTKWDLVIIDEAHEGTQTDLAKNVTDQVVTKGYTKLLELSGTPFNLLDQYDEDQVFTWDYVMEQKAKYTWTKDHPSERNPYAGLPKVNMFTFEMNKEFADFRFMGDSKKSFNFKEFFRVNSEGKFVYKDKVRQFLDNISSPDSRTNYPYSTKEFRDKLRHTLWIMPGVKEANALEKMLNQHPVFGMEYKIVNVVKDGDNEGVASESDVDKVNDAIGKDSAATKTITLTVRKLTTGVTIKPWTGVLFLSNTDSAMQYLQAAFRAQTPYSSPTFGKKTNCYIFDFAPDRALTVMAASTQLNTGVGKRTSAAQKEKMSELMNFLPILGEHGQEMKPYRVDTMLAQIKKVYAEKAVRTGFDDDSLYSDELLMLKDVDLKEFNDLKAIVGTTKSEKKPMKVDINNQGLTDEEYDQANRGMKKPKRERTQEEQDAIDKMKKLKKQRKTMISILRSISIRIPMMIYGMDIKLTDDVSINTFVKKVDNQSWQEFMPKGVTKELFLKFSKYYDQDVFIEAGRIIRRKVKELDNLDPVERAIQLAGIFGTFRNPDKETVLTPWRVVNMHLGETIGGLSFYDADYQYTTDDGVSANHWIEMENTDQIFNTDTHILEINSKTGLYPLYAGMSLYWQAFKRLNEETAGKFSFDNQLMLWQKILRENLFMVAKTPMAKAIARRTLAGYRDFDVNVEFVDNIVADAKDDVVKEAKKIRRVFGNMKFDVVIGNPPYQTTTNKKTASGQQPVTNIFQYFQELTDKLNVKYSTLIYPGKRWIHQSGKGMKKFGYNLVNDPHLAKIVFFEDASKVFDNVDIADGITIVFKDYSKTEKKFLFDFIGKDGYQQSDTLMAPGDKMIIIDPRDREIANKIDDFVALHNLKYLSESPVINRSLFKIESDFVENNPDKVRLYNSDSNVDFSKEIKLFTNDKSGKSGRAKWFVADKNVITAHRSLIKEYQVIVSSANAGGQKRDNQIQIVDNHSAFGRSRVALKSFKTLTEAQNFLTFAKSFLIRFAFLLTDESLTSLGKEVPDLLNYSDNNTFIDYSKPIDNQLYQLFGFNADQIEYIEKVVNDLR